LRFRELPPPGLAANGTPRAGPMASPPPRTIPNLGSLQKYKKTPAKLLPKYHGAKANMKKRISRVGPFEGEAPEGAHNVYVLLDETTGTVFYVGVTSKPMRRARAHYHDTSSGAYSRLRSEGDKAMIVVASFDCRLRALQVEAALHAEYPAVLGHLSGRRAAVAAS
jgi:predicted GIY-YIG superfamily endonuclease